MGTLFSQPPREERLLRWGAGSIARALEIMQIPDTRKPTPAEWHAACDIVRTALAVQSADAQDEQLAGFGEILVRIADALRGMRA